MAALHDLWNFPDQGLNLCPLQWKHGVLTTGPPGKSQNFQIYEKVKIIEPIPSVNSYLTVCSYGKWGYLFIFFYIYFIFLIFIYLFKFWLHWVFVAVLGLLIAVASLVAERGL